MMQNKRHKDRKRFQGGGPQARPRAPQQREPSPERSQQPRRPEQESRTRRESPEAPEETDPEVEVNAIAGLLAESTSPEERDYLFGALEQDPQLASVLDKVLTYASEESDEGLVEGGTPGATDSIAARVDDGEFIFPADAVEVIGVDVLQDMMDKAMAQSGSRPSPERREEPRAPRAVGLSTPAQPSLLERGSATPAQGPGPRRT